MMTTAARSRSVMGNHGPSYRKVTAGSARKLPLCDARIIAGCCATIIVYVLICVLSGVGYCQRVTDTVGKLNTIALRISVSKINMCTCRHLHHKSFYRPNVFIHMKKCWFFFLFSSIQNYKNEV